MVSVINLLSSGNMRGCNGTVRGRNIYKDILLYTYTYIRHVILCFGFYVPWKFNDMFALLSPNTLQALQR